MVTFNLVIFTEKCVRKSGISESRRNRHSQREISGRCLYTSEMAGTTVRHETGKEERDHTTHTHMHTHAQSCACTHTRTWTHMCTHTHTLFIYLFLKNLNVDFTKYWNPKLIVQNLIDHKKKKTWREIQYGKSDEAYVVEKRRICGHFSEKLELDEFPFDSQVCKRRHVKIHFVLVLL